MYSRVSGEAVRDFKTVLALMGLWAVRDVVEPSTMGRGAHPPRAAMQQAAMNTRLNRASSIFSVRTNSLTSTSPNDNCETYVDWDYLTLPELPLGGGVSQHL